jgi:amino-acid N-acetyltransferase
VLHLTMVTRAARPDDEPAVLALVEAAGLPTSGLAALITAGHALVAEHGDAVIGCVALEPAGAEVLLRSLAVEPILRGQGVGDRLVRGALAGIPGTEVWALTETAEAFLTRRGFTPVDRQRVTGPVTATGEWSQLCPASATVLHLTTPLDP